MWIVVWIVACAEGQCGMSSYSACSAKDRFQCEKVMHVCCEVLLSFIGCYWEEVEADLSDDATASCCRGMIIKSLPKVLSCIHFDVLCVLVNMLWNAITRSKGRYDIFSFHRDE